jgi:hypothetical protein
MHAINISTFIIQIYSNADTLRKISADGRWSLEHCRNRLALPWKPAAAAAADISIYVDIHERAPSEGDDDFSATGCERGDAKLPHAVEARWPVGDGSWRGMDPSGRRHTSPRSGQCNRQRQRLAGLRPVNRAAHGWSAWRVYAPGVGVHTVQDSLWWTGRQTETTLDVQGSTVRREIQAEGCMNFTARACSIGQNVSEKIRPDWRILLGCYLNNGSYLKLGPINIGNHMNKGNLQIYYIGWSICFKGLWLLRRTVREISVCNLSVGSLGSPNRSILWWIWMSEIT